MRSHISNRFTHKALLWFVHSTYADEEDGNRSQDSGGKGQRDDLGRVLGVVAENMVNLGTLSISQRRLVGRRSAGVALDVDVKDGRDNGLGRAKGAQNDLGLEGLLGLEKLDGEVLVSLYREHIHKLAASFVFRLRLFIVDVGRGRGGCPYNFDGSLAGFLNGQGKRRLEPGLDLAEDEEGLVRALGLTGLLGREGQLQGAGVAKGDLALDADGIGEPISIEAKLKSAHLH